MLKYHANCTKQVNEYYVHTNTLFVKLANTIKWVKPTMEVNILCCFFGLFVCLLGLLVGGLDGWFVCWLVGWLIY